MFNKAALRKNALPCLVLVGLAVAGPLAAYVQESTQLAEQLAPNDYLAHAISILIFAALICQVSLSAAWIVLANQRPLTRLVTGLFVLVAMAMFRVLPYAFPPYALKDYESRFDAIFIVWKFFTVTSEATALFLLLGLVHIAGKIVHGVSSVPMEKPVASPAQWQFSIRGVLAVMTAIAVILASGRGLFPKLDWGSAILVFLTPSSILLFFGFLVEMLPALPIILIALSPRQAKLIVVTYCAAAPFLFVCRFFAKAVTNTGVTFHWQILALEDMAHMVLLAVSLYILRRAGWLRVSGQTNTAPLAYSTAEPLHVDS